jgi:hypothetical protein
MTTQYKGIIRLDTKKYGNDYKVLARSFRVLFLEFLYQTKQLGVSKVGYEYLFESENAEDAVNALIELNLIDIRNGKKPFGFNGFKQDSTPYKLVFPISDELEFYVSTTDQKMTKDVTTKLSEMLWNRRIKHEKIWNEFDVKTKREYPY